jgi:hypothetical protein
MGMQSSQKTKQYWKQYRKIVFVRDCDTSLVQTVYYLVNIGEFEQEKGRSRVTVYVIANCGGIHMSVKGYDLKQRIHWQDYGFWKTQSERRVVHRSFELLKIYPATRYIPEHKYISLESNRGNMKLGTVCQSQQK